MTLLENIFFGNKLKLKDERCNNIFEAIGFNMADFFHKFLPNKPFDIAYTLYEDTWDGDSVLKLKLKDVKFI